jgi:DNA-binding transcriptional ArsR family regulator
VNGLPATNFEHHFVVNIGKELVLFDTGNGMGRMATFAARAATACALSMMQRLSNEMRGGQRSLKSTGSRSLELRFSWDRAAFRPVRSQLLVGIVPNNLSFHLDRLRHAGLITVVRKGRRKIYVARGEIVKNLRNYLTVCTHTTPSGAPNGV